VAKRPPSVRFNAIVLRLKGDLNPAPHIGIPFVWDLDKVTLRTPTNVTPVVPGGAQPTGHSEMPGSYQWTRFRLPEAESQSPDWLREAHWVCRHLCCRPHLCRVKHSIETSKNENRWRALQISAPNLCGLGRLSRLSCSSSPGDLPRCLVQLATALIIIIIENWIHFVMVQGVQFGLSAGKRHFTSLRLTLPASRPISSSIGRSPLDLAAEGWRRPAVGRPPSASFVASSPSRPSRPLGSSYIAWPPTDLVAPDFVLHRPRRRRPYRLPLSIHGQRRAYSRPISLYTGSSPADRISPPEPDVLNRDVQRRWRDFGADSPLTLPPNRDFVIRPARSSCHYVHIERRIHRASHDFGFILPFSHYFHPPVALARAGSRIAPRPTIIDRSRTRGWPRSPVTADIKTRLRAHGAIRPGTARRRRRAPSAFCASQRRGRRITTPGRVTKTICRSGRMVCSTCGTAPIERTKGCRGQSLGRSTKRVGKRRNFDVFTQCIGRSRWRRHPARPAVHVGHRDNRRIPTLDRNRKMISRSGRTACWAYDTASIGHIKGDAGNQMDPRRPPARWPRSHSGENKRIDPLPDVSIAMGDESRLRPTGPRRQTAPRHPLVSSYLRGQLLTF
jgi:hypothetical protein